MEDKEIIKALECCPLDDIGGCRKIDALDLISRQKAEIKSLTEKFEALGDPLQDAQYKIAEQRAEIERLQKVIETMTNEQLQLGFEAKSKIEKAKAEAIKEFAERLCNGRVSNDPIVIAVKSELKEMDGDIRKIEHNSLCETDTYKVGE